MTDNYKPLTLAGLRAVCPKSHWDSMDSAFKIGEKAGAGKCKSQIRAALLDLFDLADVKITDKNP